MRPLLQIAHALRSRGHDVAFYTGDRWIPQVEEQGFVCFPFVHNTATLFLSLIADDNRGRTMARPLQLRARLREWLIDSVPDQVRDLAPVLDEWRPDGILSDYSMWGPMLVLHETHDATVAVASILITCQLPGPEAPPGFGRPHNRRGRFQQQVFQFLRHVLFTRYFMQAANAVREQHGLAPITTSVAEYTGHMPLYLVPSIPELDGQRTDLPASVRYTGPWHEVGAWPDRTSPAPERIDPEATLVIVVTAAGSAGDSDLARCAEHGIADVQIKTGPLHPDLLSGADVVVCNGDVDTVMSTLQEGVPLVIVPEGMETPENAQRVVEAGAGVRLDRKACTPRRLSEEITRVLGQPSYRRSAQRLAESLSRHDGPALAAEYLEDLAVRT